jgi:molybdopterin-containing oxidoreductase family iron-sulfur binding subunit
VISLETGAYSLMQPTSRRSINRDKIEESLLVWMNGKNNPANNYYNYLKLML